MPADLGWAVFPLTILTVAAFTFLFDLLDLRPEVGSFDFVGTWDYRVYCT